MAVFIPDEKCLTLLIKKIFLAGPILIRDQWRHLELMEPHSTTCALVSSVRCTSVCQSCHVIRRWINSLTLLPQYLILIATKLPKVELFDNMWNLKAERSKFKLSLNNLFNVLMKVEIEQKVGNGVPSLRLPRWTKKRKQLDQKWW